MVIIDGAEMVDVQEASKIARRTPETIRRWVRSGLVRSTRQGNRLFVSRVDLDVGRDAGSAAQPSLRDWAVLVATRRDGAPGVSAQNFVHESRADRTS